MENLSFWLGTTMTTKHFLSNHFSKGFKATPSSCLCSTQYDEYFRMCVCPFSPSSMFNFLKIKYNFMHQLYRDRFNNLEAA